MTSAPTVTVASLQRELLAVIKGREVYSTWAKVNGVPLSERVSARAGINKAARVRQIRLAIHALDPDALLYFSWHGGEPAALEFAALVSRARAASARSAEQFAGMDDTLLCTGSAP